MKRQKFQGFKKLSTAIWKSRGEMYPVFVDIHNNRNGAGIDYQHFACDASGKLLCAGVSRHERMNRAIANQIVKVWYRWAKEYRNHSERKVALLIVHPSGNSGNQERFEFTQSV